MFIRVCISKSQFAQLSLLRTEMRAAGIISASGRNSRHQRTPQRQEQVKNKVEIQMEEQKRLDFFLNNLLDYVKIIKVYCAVIREWNILR